MINEQNEKNVTLSARMQGILHMLACEVRDDKVIPNVLDIGCDHAFVSIACIQRKIANHVIAMDVRQGPLSIAQSNIKSYGLEKCVETRLSDGLEKANVHEASWAIIAGMGGELIRKILQNGKAHLDAGIGLVLQPQSELDTVRTFLYEQNYLIVDELFLQEEGKFYTIIKAKKTSQCYPLKPEEAMYGPVLLKRMEPLFQKYLHITQQKKQELYDVLLKKNTLSAAKRCKELESELSMLKEIWREYHAV